MNNYQSHGFASRSDYLESLCQEYPREFVLMAADALGPNEDFDGLVTMLEDAADFGDFDDFDGE